MTNRELIPAEAKAIMTRSQRHDINYIEESLDLADEFIAIRYPEGVRENTHDAVARVKFVLAENYPIGDVASFLERVIARTKNISDFTSKLRPSSEKDEIVYNLNRLTAMREQVVQQHVVPMCVPG
jgi:hypothetical protein